MKQSKRHAKHGLMLSFLMIGLLFSTIQNGLAHSPASLSLAYNQQTSTLTVSITHTVEDKTTHYISEIQIFINNTLFNTSNYISLPTNSQFSYNFTISAEPNDTIKVIAKFNISGQATKELLVSNASGTDGEQETNPNQNPNSEQTINGFQFIIPIT